MKIVGVDIGGTSIKLGVFSSNGNEKEVLEYNTESHKSGKYIIERLIEQIEKFKDIDGIGISVAGQVDREQGIIVQGSSNIPQTSGLQVKALLENYFKVPVMVENDVNAAALGENHFGVGKKLSDFLFLTYGTGIGGAIVHNSSIYYGRDGYAAEFGHIITHGFGDKCRCGLLGCYETYASTTSLVREAKKINPAYINGRVIFVEFFQGNQMVIEIIENWVEEIVLGLISLIHIFNPSTIVIGGGVMEQVAIVKMISERVNNQMLESFKKVQIIKSSLGNKAGMLGAASLHFSQFNGQ